MTISYSAKNHACYDSRLAYSELPDDLVLITESEHQIFTGNTLPPRGQRLRENHYPFQFEPIPAESGIQRATRLRAERDDLLRATDLLVSVPDYTLSNDTPLTTDQKNQITSWRASLRKLPANELWPDLELPSAPTWLKNFLSPG